mgnify:CR=1 FL=1
MTSSKLSSFVPINSLARPIINSGRKYNKWGQGGAFGKEMEQERDALREKLGDKDKNLALKAKKANPGIYQRVALPRQHACL